jgi:DNA-binding response OmpR family regulator
MGHVIAFRRTPGLPENRQGPDRRSVRRGGRRATDKPGYAPLVLLIDADEDSNARCEAILARLHFAVAPARSIEEAKKVMEALRPNLVVARIADAAALKQATGADLPLVLLADDLMDPEALVEEIRRELRARQTP